MSKWVAISSSVQLPTTGPRSKKANAAAAGKQKKQSMGFGKQKKSKEAPQWQCAQGCGACCKLDKGPSFATPEEIFQSPSDVQLYKSLVGADGWCVNYDKTTRTCSIYSDRPYFCRVEPDIFKALYGIDEKKFNKEACGFCRDTIKAIYGYRSQELDNFDRITRNSSSAYIARTKAN